MDEAKLRRVVFCRLQLEGSEFSLDGKKERQGQRESGGGNRERKTQPVKSKKGSIVHVPDTKVMPVKVFRKLMIKPHFRKSGLQKSLRKQWGEGARVHTSNKPEEPGGTTSIN